jgi:cytochrome d ubiquinol oxidase subunit II
MMLIGYAVFDGIDLGVGALHMFVARTEPERKNSLSAIGPFWAGYEVWLVVAGGSMVAAFPRLYAASFSGFYIVLTLVLWLLIGRGVSIEMRSRIADPMWHSFFDVAFSASSAALAVVYGAAFGNVVRGVPLDASGNFQGSLTLALNPYAILVGVLSLVVLSMHGANFLAYRTSNEISARAASTAIKLWPVVLVLSVVVTGISFFVRPELIQNFLKYPWLAIMPLIFLGGLGAVRYYQAKKYNVGAIISGAVMIFGLLGSGGASLYPSLLPNLNGGAGLTVFNSASTHACLVSALILNMAGMVGVVGYQIVIHRLMRGKVDLEPAVDGY